MNPMLNALRNKKAHGLDVTIILGGPKGELNDDDDAKELGMAPDATPLGEEQDAHDVALGKAGHHDNMMPGEELINHPDAKQDKMLIDEELQKAQMGRKSIAHRAHGMMHKK